GIRLENLADMGKGRCLEGADDADAGIVDQHGERPCSLPRAGNAWLVCDVERDEAKAGRWRPDGLARRSAGLDDGPALGEAAARGLEPIARRAAGDQYRVHVILRCSLLMKSG